MNEAQFLLSLGYQPKIGRVHPNGLYAPALDKGLGVSPRSSLRDPMIETMEELNAQIDAVHTLADKVLPCGRHGATWV